MIDYMCYSKKTTEHGALGVEHGDKKERCVTKMSMNVNGQKVMVFTKDYNGKTLYSVGISGRKYENGQKTNEWVSAYVNAQFPRDNVPLNKQKIDITKGFLTAFEGKDGKPGIKMVVQEWRPVDDGGWD